MHNTENTISTRDNPRAIFTLRRVMSTCRKRCRINTSHTQRQQQLGNSDTGRISYTMRSSRPVWDSNKYSVVLSMARLSIRSIIVLGRWIWVDLRGGEGKVIRGISTYRVSQDSPAQARETVSYKQQVRSLMLRGVKKNRDF